MTTTAKAAEEIQRYRAKCCSCIDSVSGDNGRCCDFDDDGEFVDYGDHLAALAATRAQWEQEQQAVRADAAKWREHEAFINSLKNPIPPEKIEEGVRAHRDDVQRRAEAAAEKLREGGFLFHKIYIALNKSMDSQAAAIIAAEFGGKKEA
jgi:hypothetical protein